MFWNRPAGKHYRFSATVAGPVKPRSRRRRHWARRIYLKHYFFCSGTARISQTLEAAVCGWSAQPQDELVSAPAVVTTVRWDGARVVGCEGMGMVLPLLRLVDAEMQMCRRAEAQTCRHSRAFLLAGIERPDEGRSAVPGRGTVADISTLVHRPQCSVSYCTVDRQPSTVHSPPQSILRVRLARRWSALACHRRSLPFPFPLSPLLAVSKVARGKLIQGEEERQIVRSLNRRSPSLSPTRRSLARPVRPPRVWSASNAHSPQLPQRSALGCGRPDASIPKPLVSLLSVLCSLSFSDARLPARLVPDQSLPAGESASPSAPSARLSRPLLTL